MSIATVVTRGYGSFGTIADVAVRGYLAGAGGGPDPTPETPTGGGSTKSAIEARLRRGLRKELERRRVAYAKAQEVVPVADAPLEPAGAAAPVSQGMGYLGDRLAVSATATPAPPPIGPQHAEAYLAWLERAEDQYLLAIKEQDRRRQIEILAQFQAAQIARRREEVELVLLLL